MANLGEDALTNRCAACGTRVDPHQGLCARCGARLAPADPQVPRPPRADPSRTRAAVGAAALGVAVMLATGLYISSRITAAPPGDLSIRFGSPYWSGNSAALPLSYVSLPIGPQAYRVNVAVNGTQGDAVAMPTRAGEGSGVSVSPPGYSFRIDWWDIDYDAKLSSNDVFTVTPTMATILCCLVGAFSVRWAANDAVLAEAPVGPFMPNTPSTVQLGNVVRSNPPSAIIPVAWANPPTPGTYFQFQLVVGDNWSEVYGLPLPNGPAGNVSVGGRSYLVGWSDADTDQRVDAGDGFSVTLNAGARPPAGSNMEFMLQWYNGLTLAEAFWTA